MRLFGNCETKPHQLTWYSSTPRKLKRKPGADEKRRTVDEVVAARIHTSAGGVEIVALMAHGVPSAAETVHGHALHSVVAATPEIRIVHRSEALGGMFMFRGSAVVV